MVKLGVKTHVYRPRNLTVAVLGTCQVQTIGRWWNCRRFSWRDKWTPHSHVSLIPPRTLQHVGAYVSWSWSTFQDTKVGVASLCLGCAGMSPRPVISVRHQFSFHWTPRRTAALGIEKYESSAKCSTSFSKPSFVSSRLCQPSLLIF